MPRLTTTCTQPGCPNTATTNSRCPTHQRPDTRPSRHTRTQHGGNWRQTQLRNAALQRDHHTCHDCGHHDPTGTTLEVHHTNGLTNDTLQGRITLCRPCHLRHRTRPT